MHELGHLELDASAHFGLRNGHDAVPALREQGWLLGTRIQSPASFARVIFVLRDARQISGVFNGLTSAKYGLRSFLHGFE